MTHPGNQKGTTVNHPINPSVEAFLSAPYDPTEDEDDLPENKAAAASTGGDLWRVANALEALVDNFRPQPMFGDVHVSGFEFTPTQPGDAPALAYVADPSATEALQLAYEKLADAEDQLKTMGDVISNVEAALGKSKAAPALAAKAVIEAWKNPTVEEPAEDTTEPASDLEVRPDAATPVEVVRPDNAPDLGPELGSYPGHTRTPHPEGPDFCRECSGELQEWITWPCPAVSGQAQPLATGPEEGHEPVAQPVHDAPVEEWRAYARHLGYAGPDIDKANRSMIRTTLGIAQPAPLRGGA